MARKKQTSNPIVLSDGSVDDGKGRIVTTSDGRKAKVDALASSEYWRRREARQQTKNIRDEQKIGEEMKKIYLRMFRESRTQIDAFYQRYADKNGITLAEARKRVSQMDINAYAAKAKKYVKDRDLSDQANEEMALYNLTMKVNRLEMLKAEMGMALVDGFEEMSGIIDRELTERAMSEYERKAGILGKTVQNPAAKAAAIVNASFHNATWSERLWSHQEALKTEIGRQLMSGLIAGKSSRDMAREIRKIFGGSLQNAQRLMVTELARVQTEAARQSMEANGNTEYEYMATGPHPCPECMKLDGKVFKIREMQVGVNAPPLHPSCHCCTAPYVGGEKYKRWLEALERGEDVRWRDFEEWEERGEAEESRKATPGECGVDWPKVQAPEYRNALEKIISDQKAVDAVLTRARWALNNRDGKETEEIYAVSLSNGERREISRITNQSIPSGVKRTKSFTRKLNEADSLGESILLLHNHPRGMPPSISDINLLKKNKNVVGITVGHDGSIYFYTRPEKIITDEDFRLAVSNYARYSEITATEKALNELSVSHGFKVMKLR